MEIRRPTAQETAAVRRLWELSFPEGGPAYIDWIFADLYRPAEALALYAEDRMAASLMMVPYRMSLRGRAVAVETLSGVDTDPEMRNRGYAKTLMTAALRDMADRGLGFTFLYPFDHCFYIRLGWQTVSHALEYTCPAVELPAMPQGYTVVAAPDRRSVAALYDKAMAGYNCRVLRGDGDWQRRFGENRSLGGFLLAAECGGELCAYAFCEPDEQEINLAELISLTPAAAQAVLSQLAHYGKDITWKAPADDELSLMPGRWYGRIRHQPHTMLRVANLPQAVAQLPAAGAGEVVLEVSDTLCPWNAGTWRLIAQEGSAKAEPTEALAQYRCDIGTLCRILSGALGATQALHWGLAHGESEAAALLDRLYPRQNNFTHELY